MEVERRYLPGPSYGSDARTERRAAGSGIVSGHGAVFWNPSDPNTQYDMRRNGFGFIERINPAAFTLALKRPDDVRALWQHNADYPLARTSAGTLKLSVDRVGLRYEFKAPNTSYANDLVESLSLGNVTGSSFAFIVDDDNWTEDTWRGEDVVIREIMSVQLIEVSAVSWPAYKAATASVRMAPVADDDLTVLELGKRRRASATPGPLAREALARAAQIERGQREERVREIERDLRNDRIRQVMAETYGRN